MLGKSNSGDDSFAHWFCVSYSHSFVSLRLSASVQAVFLINNAAVSRQTDDQTKREMWCREGGTPTQTYRVGKPIFAFMKMEMKMHRFTLCLLRILENSPKIPYMVFMFVWIIMKIPMYSKYIILIRAITLYNAHVWFTIHNSIDEFYIPYRCAFLW